MTLLPSLHLSPSPPVPPSPHCVGVHEGVLGDAVRPHLAGRRVDGRQLQPKEGGAEQRQGVQAGWEREVGGKNLRGKGGGGPKGWGEGGRSKEDLHWMVWLMVLEESSSACVLSLPLPSRGCQLAQTLALPHT